MPLAKIITIERKKIITLAKFIALAGVASLAPLFLSQQITGPVVNAILFIATVILGPEKAIIIALTPSPFALSFGLLPSVLAPMIPFIMLGNAILVYVFGALWRMNYWLGMVLSSFFKFIFLAISSNIVMDLLLKTELAPKVALMMSWPQLFTALTGGLIAYVFLQSFKLLAKK